MISWFSKLLPKIKHSNPTKLGAPRFGFRLSFATITPYVLVQLRRAFIIVINPRRILSYEDSIFLVGSSVPLFSLSRVHLYLHPPQNWQSSPFLDAHYLPSEDPPQVLRRTYLLNTFPSVLFPPPQCPSFILKLVRPTCASRRSRRIRFIDFGYGARKNKFENPVLVSVLRNIESRFGTY